MTYRSGVGSYRYGAERPHAVTNASNNGGPTEFLDYKYNLDFQYDANGNLMVGAGRLYTWNSFNKPEQIQRGAEGSRFEYDADRARVLEVQTRITDNLRQVTQILTSGVYERRITTNGILQDRVHVTAGGEMVAVLTAAAADVVTPGTSTTMPTALYMHVDHQGNVEAVTDQTGATVDRTSFDPFGARRLPTWAADPDYTESKRSHPTDRGYTGHHQPDHLQLIHMNGRVYDPYLARFISADPYIQDPSNSQSLNRYSYVWNNPINSTDPSGYWNLWKHTRDIKHWAQDNRRAIYAVAAAYFGGPWGAALYSFYTVKNDGGSTASALRGAAISGITASAFNAVGSVTEPYSLGNVLGHGLVGGTSTALQGGNFGSGFISASVAAAIPLPDNPGLATATAFLVGGTASVLGGGKFANGAVTASFGYLFNHFEHERQVAQAIQEAIDQGYQVVKNFELTVDVGGGQQVKAIADYAYVNSANELVLGEVKTGLGAKFTGNQKILYEAALKGRVLLSNKSLATLGLSSSKGVTVRGLTLLASPGARVLGSAGRMWFGRGVAGAVTILGSAPVFAADMLLTSSPLGENSDCPGCLVNGPK